MTTPPLWTDVLMLNHPFKEEIRSNFQPEPLLMHPVASSSCPATCCPGEEANPHLATTSFQAGRMFFMLQEALSQPDKNYQSCQQCY